MTRFAHAILRRPGCKDVKVIRTVLPAKTVRTVSKIETVAPTPVSDTEVLFSPLAEDVARHIHNGRFSPVLYAEGTR